MDSYFIDLYHMKIAAQWLFKVDVKWTQAGPRTKLRIVMIPYFAIKLMKREICLSWFISPASFNTTLVVRDIQELSKAGAALVSEQ